MKRYFIKIFFEHLAFGLTLPIIVIWQLSKGLSLTQAGFIAALIGLTTFILELPTGLISDKLGRRKTLIAASLAHLFSVIVLVMASSFFTFGIFAILSGIGWALLSGTEEAFLFEESQAKEKAYRSSFSKALIADELGTLVGLLGATILTKLYSLQFTVIASIIFLTISLMISLSLKENNAPKPVSQLTTRPSEKVFKNYSRFIPVLVLFAIYYDGGRIVWQPHLVGTGVAVYQLGFLFAIFKLFSLLGSWLARKEYKKSLESSLLILGICLSLVFVGMSSGIVYLSVISFCFYSLLENYMRVVQSDFLNNLVIKKRATFLSFNSMIRNIYSTGLVPILAWLALSGTSKPFLVLGSLQIIASIPIFFVTRNLIKSQVEL